MSHLRIGRVRMAHVGDFNVGTTYLAMDSVLYQGASYVAKLNVPLGLDPVADIADEGLYWQMVSSKGDVGPAGEQGDAGPQGIQGVQGGQGIQGEQGDAGPQGNQGVQGEDGPVGSNDWNTMANIPQTASRWPTFGEIDTPPAQATRWPVWDEVTGKPTSFPVDASSHDHEKLIESTATAPFDDADNAPRSFFDVGLCIKFVADTEGWPIPFGKLLNIPSFDATQDGGGLQILTPYSAAYTEGGNYMYRIGLYNNGGWTAWKTVVSQEEVAEDLNSLHVAIQAVLDNKLASGDFTASSIRTLLKTVDGADSGIDADLLDGQHGSFFYSPTNAPPSSQLTNAQVRAAYAGVAYKGVGSYAMSGSSITKTTGSTYSGSSIGLSSGTWRCMGEASKVSNIVTTYTYLFLRVS